MKVTLILNSSAGNDEAVIRFSQQCREHGVDVIAMGDWEIENNMVGWNRGYVIARKSDCLIEVGDHSYPKESFWKKNAGNYREVNGEGWINVYRMFSDELIWPRGLPLDHAKDLPGGEKESAKGEGAMERIKILQGLTDENPDVDAVYRMAHKFPFNFKDGEAVVLKENQWCPFNSLNTLWYKDAFPLLYLPSCCNFRMRDIWRSFIAQRILWTCGWRVAFHKADVTRKQEMQEALIDFKDELQGYMHTDLVRKRLMELELESGEENMAKNMVRCYGALVDVGVVQKEEMDLLEVWLEAMG
jgi:hypothetical protein